MSTPISTTHPLVKPQEVFVKMELLTVSRNILSQALVLRPDLSRVDWWKDCSGHQNWCRVGWFSTSGMAKFSSWLSDFGIIWRPQIGCELGVTPGWFGDKPMLQWCSCNGLTHVYLK